MPSLLESMNKAFKEPTLLESIDYLLEEISPEDQHDSDILRGIRDKMSVRANAKLTPEEQEILKKYNLRRDTYDRTLRVSGPEGTSYLRGMSSDIFNPGNNPGHKDRWGDRVARPQSSKVNYADRARKLPDRLSKRLYVDDNGFKRVINPRDPNRTQAERDALGDIQQGHVNYMKRQIDARDWAQKQMDTADDQYDKDVRAIENKYAEMRKQYEKDLEHAAWRRDLYKNSTDRDKAQAEIDKMLKRSKKESLEEDYEDARPNSMIVMQFMDDHYSSDVVSREFVEALINFIDDDTIGKFVREYELDE